MIEDPEGYLLEFERFNPHAENEAFLPLLRGSPTVRANDSAAPHGLGFSGTVTWLYYKELLQMQGFYEEVLGLRPVADQGWARIYQGSRSGFVGLVDERRGMHRWTGTKAVNVSFLVDDIDGWFRCVRERKSLRATEVSRDEAGRPHRTCTIR